MRYVTFVTPLYVHSPRFARSQVRKSTGAEESAKIKRRARAKELRDREIAEAEAARVVRTSKRGEAAVGYAPAHYQHHQQAKDVRK